MGNAQGFKTDKIGFQVTSVKPLSPGAACGLREVDDFILTMNGLALPFMEAEKIMAIVKVRCSFVFFSYCDQCICFSPNLLHNMPGCRFAPYLNSFSTHCLFNSFFIKQSKQSLSSRIQSIDLLYCTCIVPKLIPRETLRLRPALIGLAKVYWA